MWNLLHGFRTGLVFTLALCPVLARGAEPVKISMTPDHWTAKEAMRGEPRGTPEFLRREGFPNGILKLNGGAAALKGLTFRNGTIEFDLSPIGNDIPGIRFRQRDDFNAEEFYLRPSSNCPGSNDCLQYAPIINGFMLWDMYPEYQTTAPVTEHGWNHVKLVISGRRMNVFVNHAQTPTLIVPRLQADTLEGGLELRGPAGFANLVVTPDAVEGLSPTPLPDLADSTIVRKWSISNFEPLPQNRAPLYTDMPAQWQPVATELNGMVNVNRRYTSADRQTTPVVWLKTILDSDHAQNTHVSLGFLREAWIFVNGEPLTTGHNFYYPESERRDPDGRFSFENGGFDLPLQKGPNEIVIALSAPWGKRVTYYGWGMKLRVDRPQGITINK